MSCERVHCVVDSSRGVSTIDESPRFHVATFGTSGTPHFFGSKLSFYAGSVAWSGTTVNDARYEWRS